MSETDPRRAREGRVPPGQYLTERLPVLHAGTVPRVDAAAWEFTVGGLVAEPLRLDFASFRALPTREVVADIHCVTKWSKLDTRWEGVPVADLLARARPEPQATHVLVRAEHGFTANLPLADFARPENLFAYRYAGAEIEPDHGWPLRLVVPAPLLLEVGQVGPGLRPARPRRARLLGAQRVPHVRRPLAGAALLGRLSRPAQPAACSAARRRSTMARIPPWRRYSTSTGVSTRAVASNSTFVPSARRAVTRIGPARLQGVVEGDVVTPRSRRGPGWRHRPRRGR